MATILALKLHIFSRDSLVAFDSYQFKKVRKTNQQLQPFGCVLLDMFCSCVWDFYSRGKWLATWSSRCALKSLCCHTYYIGAVCLFFFNTDKNKQMWFLWKKT